MRIVALAAVAIGVFLAACEGDENENNIVVPGVPSGFFILQTLGGRSLPATVTDTTLQPIRVDVASGSLRLNGDRTFATVTELRATFAGLDTTRIVACTGTFTRVADTLTLVEIAVRPDCGRTYTATVSRTTLTTTLFNEEAVYSR